jgi:hypothetical protein
MIMPSHFLESGTGGSDSKHLLGAIETQRYAQNQEKIEAENYKPPVCPARP